MNKSTMNIDVFTILSVTTIVAICFGFGDSVLVTVPHDTVAVVGRTAYFNCSTSNIPPEIHWHYGKDKYVYAGGKFISPYDTFRIEINNSTGSCNLVIPNVTRDDAGQYHCLDNKGFGEKRSAELVVLDENPVCSSDMKADGIVGPNNCNIDPEDVRLSCSATYKGNIPPIIKWTRLGDNSPINNGRTMCKNSTNRVDCNLTIKADSLQLDGSSYICHTELTTNINCTSDAIDIIYSFNDFRITERSMNDELSCKVNSSEQCNKRWIWNAFDGSSTVLWDQSNVTADRSGIYRCESECNIRGKRCAVSAMMVYIPSDNKTVIVGPPPSDPETSVSAASHSTVVLAILVVLLAVCVVCLLVCYIIWRHKLKEEKQKHKKNNSEEMQLTTDIKDHDENKYEKLQLRPTTVIQGNNNGAQNEPNGDSYDDIDHCPRQENEVKALKEKLELADKEVKRLVKRNVELGRSLCLPPKDPIEYKVEPHKTIKTLASQGPKNLGVCGVAVLDKELFVISDSQPEVEVYDMETFKHSRTIQLHGVMDPGDIVACDKNKRIYIVDWTERTVENKMLRLDINGKEDKETNEGEDKQRLSLTDDECRLFVTRDSNVLVTFYRSRKIVEYTLDLDMVSETKIRDASIHPIHSVKLSNGFFAICHARKNESTHSVCIVNDDGSLLKLFGGRKGAGVGQVNFPTYLAVDRNDNILVADRDNGRVLVLNSSLDRKAELLAKKDKLRFPRVLLLDETNSRLVVADCDDLVSDGQFSDGQVLTFNLK